MSNNNQDAESPAKGRLHQGLGSTSPYPVSRLAPAVELLDLAKEIAHADEMINGRVTAKLQVIADQVKSLQAQARKILEDARRDQHLNHAKCAFKRIPGCTYHLYARPNGDLEFSMLSPRDWGGTPPCRFQGSFRLESDMSWVPTEQAPRSGDTRETVYRLLEATSDLSE